MICISHELCISCKRSEMMSRFTKFFKNVFMASRLLLIRHADTGPANWERLVGSTDITASPSGLDAVGRLADMLERFAPELWYCLPC